MHAKKSASRPIIGVTLGDVNGIGPEVVAKALSAARARRSCIPVVFGSAEIIAAELKRVGSALTPTRVEEVSEVLRLPRTRLGVYDTGVFKPGRRALGKVRASAGRAALRWIEQAVTAAQRGELNGICTAPIHKEAIHRAGSPFQGHTELLAHLTGTKEYRMLLVSGALRAIHLSTHYPLREAIRMVTRARVYSTILLAVRALGELGLGSGRLAVAGLNPHAGEGGLFGDEEIKVIRPAIVQAKRSLGGRGVEIHGPEPPDTVFNRMARGEFDMVVAMYHDQGFIPLKTVGFERGVDVTVGLPIVRTSPAHGTAFGIAGRGVADPRAMLEALCLAATLARNRSRPPART